MATGPMLAQSPMRPQSVVDERADDDDRDQLAAFVEHGDEVAFARVVERHWTLVLGVCRGVLRDPADADDAAQSVFIALARRAQALVDHPALTAWLRRAAWNVA